MMKKILPLLLVLGLLMSGCSGGFLPIMPSTTAAPQTTQMTETTATTMPPETTEATTTEPVTETEAPETEPATTAAQTRPTEPVNPWSLMDEAMFVQGTYTDDLGNTSTYSYSLPCLTADTPDARAINEEIDRFFGSHVREAQSAMDEGLSLGILSVGYFGQVWEDVLTLVIIEHTDWSFDDYGVYCYDVSTGTRLSTPELLEKMGIPEHEFLKTCRNRFRQFFKDMYSEIPIDSREAAGYYDALDRVDGDQFVNLELLTYPDETGDLVVIAPIVSLAGADYYYHPIYLGYGGEG